MKFAPPPSELSRSQLAKICLATLLAFVVCTFLFLWSDDFYALSRFLSIGNNIQGHFGLAEWIRRLVFIVEYILAVSLLLSATFLKKPFNFLVLLIIWVLFTLELVAQSAYGRPADIENIAMLNAAAGNLSDALALYKDAIISCSFKSALVFAPAVVLFAFLRKSLWVRRISLFLFLGAFVTLSSFYIVILVCRGAPALVGFPKGFSYAFASVVIKVNATFSPTEKLTLSQSSIATTFGKDIRNVVVVVDESIEYSIFAKLIGTDIPGLINFGKAYSAANCSAPSNYILRRAWWRRNASNHADIKTVPSLFRIAREKGFHTVYIDNQNVLKDGAVRNYIDAEEASFIDSIYEMSGPAYKRDANALEKVTQILEQKGRHFIFINKIGAHFPYEHTLVPSAVTSDRIENYQRSVKQNAVDFLLGLSKLKGEDSVFFYTSDHGQNLNGLASHCNTGNEISEKEYTVPFIIITGNRKLNRVFSEARPVLYGKLTHLEYSETIRNLLGKEIPEANSVFNYETPNLPYCGVYGQPIRFLGVAPSCKRLE